MSESPGAQGPHRAGVVALLGRPNAGKSSLFNRLVGEKLAIVTPKAQTTRSRLLGISSLPNAQVLWLDTPGLHTGSRALDSAMAEQIREAARDCDVALLVADPREPFGEGQRSLLAQLTQAGTPVFLVATRQDLPAAAAAPWPPPGIPESVAVARVSAQSGSGVAGLVSAVCARLPESPPLFDRDQLSDRPLRFLAAERVREAAFRALAQELPYRVGVEVIQFDESREDLVRIHANLIVERESQKRIAVGRAGSVIKQIGSEARRELEGLLERRVHLELWVRVEPNWTRSPARVKELGYA
jgi:GTP-binding protein Era